MAGNVWGNDLVALTSEGQIDWVTPLNELVGAAVAGDQVFVTGRDAGSNSVAGSTLFVGKAGQVGPDGKIGRLMAFR